MFWERVLSNPTEASDRLLALHLGAQTLIKQLEELEQLRDQLRRAEAKAVGARRRQRSRRKRQTGCGPKRRGSRRVR